MKRARSKTRKAISSHPFPRTEKDQIFCDRWLEHFDHLRAWREAGFTKGNSGWRALNKLKRFAEYLRPLREAKAKVLGEKLALNQADILQAMARKAMVKPGEFVERSAEPLMMETKKNGKTLVIPREWQGKPLYGERLKPYCDLTPEQQAVVEILSDASGVIRYRLPSITEQHTYLTSLGRQFGMFLEKLIMEQHKHTHEHQHAHLHLDAVSTTQLRALGRQLLPYVAPEFAARLGFSSEDFAEASRAGAPLMPASEKSPPR